MSEPGEQPNRYDRPSGEDMRRGCAFFVAPAVAIALYVGAYVIVLEWPALSKGPDTEQILEMFRIYLGQLLVAAIPAFFVMIVLVIPAYWTLRRLNRLNLANVMVGSFIAGVAAAFMPLLLSSAIILDLRGEESWTWTHFAGTLVVALPAGIFAMLGGILFLWMTRKSNPKTDQSADGPN